MMSRQRVDPRWRLLALHVSGDSARASPEPCRLRAARRAPVFLAAGFRDRDNLASALRLPSRRGGVPCVRPASSLCRANIARGLRSPTLRVRWLVTTKRRRSPPRFGLRPASLMGCADVCGPRPVLFVIMASKVSVVSSGRFSWLAHVVLDLACLTEGRRRFAPPRSYPRNSRSRLSSPGRCASIPRGNQESRGLAALYCRAGPCGVRVDRLRSVASHRGRDGRGPGN